MTERERHYGRMRERDEMTKIDSEALIEERERSAEGTRERGVEREVKKERDRGAPREGDNEREREMMTGTRKWEREREEGS